MPPSTTPDHDASPHILVVDDEAALGRMMSRMLSARGLRVTVLNDSVEALARFRSAPRAFDAVITDQTMPGLTGRELAQAMLELRPDLPVLLTTGYSEDVDAERARALGVRGFLPKPATRDDILGAIDAILRGESWPLERS